MGEPHGFLEGEGVVLKPMTLDASAALLGAAADPRTFRYFSRVPDPWTPDGMARYCQALMQDPSVRPYVVCERATGEVVGSTTYCDLRPAHLGVEIGWTWYAPSSRGSAVNPECKLLLMEHAFGGGLFGRPALRVAFKTDARNTRSVRAIEKLGAMREGVLRSHMLMPDGHRRDSVYCSVLEAEWPDVRARLRERLKRG